MPLARCITTILATLCVILSLCFAQSDAVKEFKKEWEDAKNFPLNQKAAINKVSREMSIEAVKAILAVAFEKDASYIASQAAYDALSRMRTQEIVHWMSENVAKDSNWKLRAVMAKVLGEYGDDFSIDGLLKILGDKKWEVRLAAAKALGEMTPSRRIVDALIAQVEKEQGRLVYEMGEVLEKLTGATGLEEPEDWKNWWKKKRDSWAPPSGGTEHDGSPETARPMVGEPKTVAVSPIYGRIKSKKVIFVVDTSASMKTEGEWGESKKRMSRLDIVKEELCKVLDTQIDETCRFNIITFDLSVKAWKSKPVKATAGNKSSAKGFIKKLKADGVTYTYGALKEAFENEDIDTIYFLSDGEPTHPPNNDEVNRDWILGKVKAMNLVGSRKVHTIAFMVGKGEDFGFEEDKPKCAQFMEALAKATGGNFKKMD